MERHLDVADVGVADDRRRIARIGSARKRDMTFAGEQSRSRIEADPARTWEIHFGPGMQIGEIALRPGRTLERLLIGGELDEIPGREACGESEIAQDLHQQPGRVAARADAARERVFRRGVKLRAFLAFHVIFFATYRPDFDLGYLEPLSAGAGPGVAGNRVAVANVSSVIGNVA